MSNRQSKGQDSAGMLTEDEFRQMLNDFAELYGNRDLVEREYKLVQMAKRYDRPIDEYRRLFEIYKHLIPLANSSDKNQD